MISLLSDTGTLPTKGMLDAMMAAEVGDDVFGEDPTVNALQEELARRFGHEAALFCPSGTMSNQIALAVHTGRLEEVICEEKSHIYQYETGGYASNSGIAIKLVRGQRGKMTAEQVAAAVNPDYDWLPKSSLVVLENTCNKGGGSFYRAAEIQPIQDYCQEAGLALHLDGARLYNALVASGESEQAHGALFDSISICLSKGLGAPVGTVLIGHADFIKQARRLRKAMGGGMRQAGYLAAAGLYALEHQVERLAEDHRRAKILGECLAACPYVRRVHPVESNILLFDLEADYAADAFLADLEAAGIKASAFGTQCIRLVTHLNFDDAMLEQTCTVLAALRPK